MNYSGLLFRLLTGEPMDQAPLGTTRYAGMIHAVEGEVVWVSLFDMWGHLLEERRPLPRGDWSLWRLYETDGALRRAVFEEGARLGWWSGSEQEWEEQEQGARAIHDYQGDAAPPPRPAPPPRRAQFRAEVGKVRRFAIFQRDGFKCRYCGGREQLQLDHVVPLANGGSNADDNLVTACLECNYGKRTRDATPPECP